MNNNLTFFEKKSKKRVLVAPLDWGLGHATRCIPLIQSLQEAGFEVWAAAEERVKELLLQEFPDLMILPLPGYRVTYAGASHFFLLHMLRQLPRLIMQVKKENRLLENWVRQFEIDVVISDNRYGCHNKSCHSVFITHQLIIKTGFSFLDKLARRINYSFIKKFDECWVPDQEGESNLAGALSHPEQMPDCNVKYIGPLSRFRKNQLTEENGIVVLLSGPEPQRSIFENEIISQLSDCKEKITLVRGLPGELEKMTDVPSNVKVYTHLKGEELSSLVQTSEMVIARSGYSTVMDLVRLHKKAILVPTPGQSEQEYLAEHLSGNRMFYTVNQSIFNLKKDIDSCRKFDNSFPEIRFVTEDFIKEWSARI